jgi:hypothetical protein
VERTGLRIRGRLPEAMPPIGEEAELVIFRVAPGSVNTLEKLVMRDRVKSTGFAIRRRTRRSVRLPATGPSVTPPWSRTLT